MIATRSEDAEVFAGGVFAAANHVADFCAEVEIITCLGRDDHFEPIIRENLKPNVKLTVVYRDGVPTTRKCRFVDVSYKRKLFEVYFMDDAPLEAPQEAAFKDLIAKRAGDVDVVAIADFGHGLISTSAIETINDTARFVAVASQSNSANLGYNLITRYPRADYICIDEPEARLAVADKFGSVEDIISAGLPPRVDCSKFIITQGSYGCVTHERDGDTHTIPAFTETVIDTMGGGRCFLRGDRADGCRRWRHGPDRVHRQRCWRHEGRYRRAPPIGGKSGLEEIFDHLAQMSIAWSLESRRTCNPWI